MTLRISAFIAGIFITLALSSTAHAQQLDKTFSDWNVYTVTQDGSKICYMASAPTKKKGTYNKRGEPYLLVTHRSADSDEVSTSSGYPYKKDSEVSASLDGVLYKMFTKDELAWAYDEHQDQSMVSAMKRGMKLNIKGESQVGTTSEDLYSLKGFTSAYKRMKELCQ